MSKRPKSLVKKKNTDDYVPRIDIFFILPYCLDEVADQTQRQNKMTVISPLEQVKGSPVTKFVILQQIVPLTTQFGCFDYICK